MQRRCFKIGKRIHKVSLAETEAGRAKVRLDEGTEKEISFLRLNEHALILELPEGRVPVYLARRGGDLFVQIQGQAFQLREEDSDHSLQEASGAGEEDKTISAPMPGKVVKILVKPGASVQRTQPVIILDSMKVEIELKASSDGRVREVLVKEGQQLDMGQPLITLE
ncbi:MAG: biotin/lipoyl-binding protein [Elusimicrobia bacterium]|nr:biotin/lipoyl-binding protein [Elusimicrobiota bacterium]